MPTLAGSHEQMRAGKCGLGSVLDDKKSSKADRWGRRGRTDITVDGFVTYEDTKIKWSERLKLALQCDRDIEFDEAKLVRSLYHPFCKQWLFFDHTLNERVYQLPRFFPYFKSDADNVAILVSDHGYRAAFSAFATDVVPNYHALATTDAFQCFPYYVYTVDGSSRRENITDWALGQFQEHYGEQVTKHDIFHYIYTILHHPSYRERYVENLKIELPHIPYVKRQETFQRCVSIGQTLMHLHLFYEQEDVYPLEEIDNPTVRPSSRVEKMRLSRDRAFIEVNESLTLTGIPPECFEYRLGNRSALEWVIDQYQEVTDVRSGIAMNPNVLSDEEYIVRLVGRVVTVSVKIVQYIKEFTQAVTLEDWLEESVTVAEA